MISITDVTLSLKSAAVGLLAFWVFIIWSRFRDVRKTLAAMAVLATVKCYLFIYIVPNDSILFWPAFILNLLAPLALFNAAREFFAPEDSPKPLLISKAVMAVLCIGTLILGQPSPPPLSAILVTANALITLLAAASLWRHYRDDLISVRRNMRVIISGAFVCYVFGIGVFTSIASKDASYRMPLRALEAAALMVTFFAINATLVRREFWEIVWGREGSVNQSNEPQQFQDKHQIAQQTAKYHQVKALLNFFEHEKVYLSQKLSIGDVATKMSIPEHQLRQLINQHLGFENFNNFVNKYRIKHVAGLLRDPTRSKDKVFALALESGFSSLAPFNKAFMTEFKMTPTAYRNQKPQ